MFQNILVPLGGSSLAEAAVPPARMMVQVLGARVVLVGVVPIGGQLLAGQVALSSPMLAPTSTSSKQKHRRTSRG